MNKWLLSIFCLIIACSCEQKKYNPTLEKIDSLTELELHSPAIKLLNTINTATLSQQDLAHYYLLKNTILAREEEIKEENFSQIDYCIRYYKENNDRDKLIEAYCCKGGMYALNENMKECTQILKEAEQLIDNKTLPELKIRIYSSLSYVNSVTRNNQKALYYAKKALTEATIHKKRKWVGKSYMQIAVIYGHMNLKDSSNYYKEKTQTYINDLPMREKAVFLQNLSLYYWDKGNMEQAESCLIQSSQTRPNPYTYGTLASLYTEQGKTKKAQELWGKVFHSGDAKANTDFLQPYAEWLHKIGKEEEAWELAMKIPFVKDSIMRVQQTELIHETQEAHNRMITEMQNKQEKQQLYATLVVLVLLTAITTILFRLHAIKLKQRMAETEKELAKERQRELEYEQLVSNLQAERKEYQKETRTLKKKVEDLRQKQAITLGRGKILYEGIANGEKTNTWKKADFSDFLEYFRTFDLRFMLHLEDDYERLTHSEKFFLVLLKNGKSEKEVQETMRLSDGALRNTKYRIRQKLKEGEEADVIM